MTEGSTTFCHSWTSSVCTYTSISAWVALVPPVVQFMSALVEVNDASPPEVSSTVM